MNKLYRSRKDSILAGVCGGLGQYLSIDSTLVRLFFAFLTFFNLLGLWVYIMLALVMPRVLEGEEELTAPLPLSENPKAKKIIGSGMVVLGVLALVARLRIPWLRSFDLWPVMLILFGIVLLARVFMVED